MLDGQFSYSNSKRAKGKRCSVSSICERQAGQIGSIETPRRSKLSLEGIALWHNCQRKIGIVGKASIFQIHLNFHGDGLDPRLSCAYQVANLTENSPLLVSPQQNLSGTLVKGMSTDSTMGSTGAGKTCESFGMSYRLSGMMNSLTFNVGSMPRGLSSFISSARGEFLHHTCVQKFIICPLPNCQCIHFARKALCLSKYFQIQERDGFRVL